MYTVVALIVVILINFNIFCTGKEPTKEIRSKKLLCIGINQQIIYNLTCTLKLVNRTLQTLSFDSYLKPNVYLNWVHARIKSYYKFNVVYRQILVTIDEDICGIFSGRQKSIYIDPNAIVSDQRQNLKDGCPYKDHLYFLDQNISLSSTAYDVVPVGDWRLEVELYTKSKITEQEMSIVTVQVFFESRDVSDKLRS